MPDLDLADVIDRMIATSESVACDAVPIAVTIAAARRVVAALRLADCIDLANRNLLTHAPTKMHGKTGYEGRQLLDLYRAAKGAR